MKCDEKSVISSERKVEGQGKAVSHLQLSLIAGHLPAPALRAIAIGNVCIRRETVGQGGGRGVPTMGVCVVAFVISGQPWSGWAVSGDGTWPEGEVQSDDDEGGGGEVVVRERDVVIVIPRLVKENIHTDLKTKQKTGEGAAVWGAEASDKAGGSERFPLAAAAAVKATAAAAARRIFDSSGDEKSQHQQWQRWRGGESAVSAPMRRAGSDTPQKTALRAQKTKE